MLIEKDPDFLEMFGNYDEYHTFCQRSRASSLKRAKLAGEWVDPRSRVLDVGVGDGTLAKYLMETKKCEVVAIDVSKVAAEKVKKELGLEVFVRDVNKGLMLGKTRAFDYIIFMEVIEHLVNPQVALLEALKHARKAVVVTLPNSGFIKWRFQLLKGYFPRQSFTHLHFWTIRDFELFCRKLGIRILSFKTFLPESRIEAWLVKKLRNLLAYQQCWLLEPQHGFRTTSKRNTEARAGKNGKPAELLTLDVGCGKNKRAIIGVDIERSVGVNIVSDAHFLPFREEVFDGCYCYALLEHVDNPVKTLKEIHRILKFNGFLKVLVPTDSLLKGDILADILHLSFKHLILQRLRLKRGAHIWQFSEQSLRNLLLYNGFCCVKLLKPFLPWFCQRNPLYGRCFVLGKVSRLPHLVAHCCKV